MNGKRILFAVIAVAGCSRFEQPEIVYPSYAEAQQAGALGAGRWIPQLLPTSAVHIHEQHDIDTNERWLTFSFSGEFEMPASCTSTSEPLFVDGRDPNWWRHEAEAVSAPRSFTCTETTQLGDEWSESRCQLVINERKALYRCRGSVARCC